MLLLTRGHAVALHGLLTLWLLNLWLLTITLHRLLAISLWLPITLGGLLAISLLLSVTLGCSWLAVTLWLSVTRWLARRHAISCWLLWLLRHTVSGRLLWHTVPTRLLRLLGHSISTRLLGLLWHSVSRRSHWLGHSAVSLWLLAISWLAWLTHRLLNWLCLSLGSCLDRLHEIVLLNVATTLKVVDALLKTHQNFI